MYSFNYDPIYPCINYIDTTTVTIIIVSLVALMEWSDSANCSQNAGQQSSYNCIAMFCPN